MNQKRVRKQQICFSLTSSIKRKVDEIAYKNGMGRAEVLRRAVSEFLIREQEANNAS